MKKTANKCGMNFTLSNYKTKAPYLFFDWINDYVVELSRERQFATGGQKGANLVGFDDPIKGTIKISTQIIPVELISIAAAGNVKTGAELACREVITVAENGKITLSQAPIAGTLYVYSADSDCAGEPVATTASDKEVTVADAAAGDNYIAYYFKQDAAAKEVIFNNANTADFYRLDGYTKLKDTEGLNSMEHVKAYKIQPQQALSLTYHGSGDPMSLDVTFDVLADDDDNVYSVTRV